MISLTQKTPPEIALDVARRVRSRRKKLGFTQAQLAAHACMSLSSYKRFEQTGAVAFGSLIRIAVVLGCESDFDALFARCAYTSIEEVIDDVRQSA